MERSQHLRQGPGRSLLLAVCGVAVFASMGWALAGRPAHGHRLGPTALQPGRPIQISPVQEMVAIPPGTAWLGSSHREVVVALSLCRRELALAAASVCTGSLFQDERPKRGVPLPAYRIDVTEVTRAEYEACVRAGVCRPASAPPPLPAFWRWNAPVVNVSWRDAVTYCRWRGKRLPTAAEWERAARGDGARLWPWGNVWVRGACNTGGLSVAGTSLGPDPSDGFAYVAPVGRFPRDRSPFGVLDMAGNVAEWTATRYESLAQVTRAQSSNPTAMVVKGGSWNMPGVFSRAATNFAYEPQVRRSFLGFRCAR